MKPRPRLWHFIASRIDASGRAGRQQQHEDTAAIVRALFDHTAQKARHDAAEAGFWRRQIRAASWLNGITLAAAIIAITTVVVLLLTLRDAREATIEANRAWVAPRSAYLRRVFALNDHPVFRVTYDNIGKQPALNTETWWRVNIVDADLLVRSLKEPNLAESAFGRNPACDGRTSRKGGEIIWPSQKPETYSNSYVENPNDPIITQEVMDRRAAVVVQGCFLYETFNEVHKSAYCFWFRQVPPSYMLTTTSGAVICPIGNDAD
jgi:hypothetical protein